MLQLVTGPGCLDTVSWCRKVLCRTGWGINMALSWGWKLCKMSSSSHWNYVKHKSVRKTTLFLTCLLFSQTMSITRILYFFHFKERGKLKLQVWITCPSHTARMALAPMKISLLKFILSCSITPSYYQRIWADSRTLLIPKSPHLNLELTEFT